MKNRFPFVSIITINYNQSAVTNQLIESLSAINWPNIEIIVVDNNSAQGDAKKITKSNPNVQIIENENNLGFAGGNNVGIKASKGEYILLLNNDTEVDPDFMAPLIQTFCQHNNVGAVSPKINYFHNPKIIQYAGFTKMNPFTLRMKGIGWGKSDLGQYKKITETHFAHGCAMMVSRKVLNKIGLMPEEYFLYYEEHDWSTKIKDAGFKIFFQPFSVVYHKESISVKKNSPLKTYFINRNRILYMRRNSSLWAKILSVLYLTAISIPKNTIMLTLKKQPKHLQAYWDAIIWNITNKTKKQWKQ